MNSKPELLVLDAQGVTFNAPIHDFFIELTLKLDLPKNFMVHKWHNQLRELAWLGKINDRELVKELTYDKMEAEQFLIQLEKNFSLGPVAHRLADYSNSVPIWILSNHRSHWLYRRLERFNLNIYIEKVLVSEETGFIKPNPLAFEQLNICHIPSDKIVFVDDQLKNIKEAKRHSFNTIHMKDDADVEEIDRKLNIV